MTIHTMGEGEIHRIDSKHHTTRFDYCLDSHHQVCSESRLFEIIRTVHLIIFIECLYIEYR